MNNNFILKQGYKVIISTLLLGLFFDIFISDFLSNIFYILFFILLFVYRDIKRDNFLAKNSDILAPIDGKIIAIDKYKDSYKIYIDVGLCNSASFKAPISSNYELISVRNGLNLNSLSYKAKKLNANAILKFNDIKITLISGICNTNLSFIKSKNNILQNEELGIFLQGLVIIEVNNSSNLTIKLNQKVYSNKTIIAS